TEDFTKIVKRRTPRQLKFFSIATIAQISNDAQKEYSVLEVITADRPGLLASIGDIFIDFSIDLINAKISTLGERVEDIFFITDSNQQPITDPELCEQIQNAICQKLDEQVAETS
ncbi:MAG: [protein-PII] uridylyltransferase, partial [Psychromonas sp.]|nr:[protein-PII] uridylyltransferase [Psychromonas sp.]